MKTRIQITDISSPIMPCHKLASIFNSDFIAEFKLDSEYNVEDNF